MSRIHEALKRAAKEKGKTPAMDAAAEPVDQLDEASPETGHPVPAVISQTAATVVARVSAHAAPAELTRAAAFSAASASAAPSTTAPASSPLLDTCRRARWQGDASKLFFLSGQKQTFATEQLRMLRSRLYQERQRRVLKIVLVTSALPAEGKTFVCANLAHAIARQTEKRILLVDCDLRSPSLHAILGAPSEPGLAAYLKEEAGVEQILQRGPMENLFLIPGGTGGTNSAELLARGRMKNLLALMEPLFDWILLDAPATSPFPDAVTIADWSDGVLLVVHGGETQADVVQSAARELHRRRLLGVVLNRAGSAGAISSVAV
jgi:protein-tyrosine kinase